MSSSQEAKHSQFVFFLVEIVHCSLFYAAEYFLCVSYLKI